MPWVVILYEYFFLHDLDRKWLARCAILGIVAAVLPLLLAFAFMDGNPLQGLYEWYAKNAFTPWQRVMTEFRVVVRYIGLIFWPHPSRLNLDPDIPLSLSLLNPPTTLLSLAALLGLILAAVLSARRERLAAFAVFWFLVNLAIESSVLPLDFKFEHRTYMPSMLVVAATVTLTDAGFRKAAVPKGILLGLALLLLGFWTVQRNRVWSDGAALWQDTVNKSPGKARPHESLGCVLAQRGQLEPAIRHYRRALQINPRDGNTFNNLGMAIEKGGNLDGAADAYRQVLLLKPDFAEAHNNLGGILARQGRSDEALFHLKEAVRLKEDYSLAMGNLGNALAAAGRLEEEAASLERAVRIDPTQADLYYNLGVVRFMAGGLEEAIAAFETVLQRDPRHARAHNNLGVAWQRKGMLEKARDHYRAALQFDPGLADARRNLEQLSRDPEHR